MRSSAPRRGQYGDRQPALRACRDRALVPRAAARQAARSPQPLSLQPALASAAPQRENARPFEGCIASGWCGGRINCSVPAMIARRGPRSRGRKPQQRQLCCAGSASRSRSRLPAAARREVPRRARASCSPRSIDDVIKYHHPRIKCRSAVARRPPQAHRPRSIPRSRCEQRRGGAAPWRRDQPLRRASAGGQRGVGRPHRAG